MLSKHPAYCMVNPSDPNISLAITFMPFKAGQMNEAKKYFGTKNTALFSPLNASIEQMARNEKEEFFE